MKISEMINALETVKAEVGDLEVHLLESKNGNCLPKENYTISVCEMLGEKFVDISDVWEADE